MLYNFCILLFYFNKFLFYILLHFTLYVYICCRCWYHMNFASYLFYEIQFGGWGIGGVCGKYIGFSLKLLIIKNNKRLCKKQFLMHKYIVYNEPRTLNAPQGHQLLTTANYMHRAYNIYVYKKIKL